MFYKIPCENGKIDIDYNNDKYTYVFINNNISYVQFVSCTPRDTWEEITQEEFEQVKEQAYKNLETEQETAEE